MWKTTDFPYARKGYLYSSVLQVLLSKFIEYHLKHVLHTNILSFLLVFVTAAIQLLLWRDKRNAARAVSDDSSSTGEDSDNPSLQVGSVDEKKAVRTAEITPVSPV